MEGHFGRGKDAISSVSGVILMVEITATLTAVFGSSLFEMRGDRKGPDIVLATASNPTPDQTVVTYYGGPNHDLVDDDSDFGNTSAISGMEPEYTLKISDPGDTDSNNRKREPEWRKSHDHP